MSLSLGGILFAADFGRDPVALLGRLGLEPITELPSITLRAAARSDFRDIAVGRHAGATILIQHDLPYDCSFRPRQLSPLDRRLAALSEAGPVFCFIREDASMSSAFSFFRSGRRVRCRAVDLSAVYCDTGKSLPAEAGYDPQTLDDEGRIFAITAALLGTPLDDMVYRNALTLRVFRWLA